MMRRYGFFFVFFYHGGDDILFASSIKAYPVCGPEAAIL